MKESLSRRSKSIHSTQSTQRVAIDKASELISALMQQLAEQKKKYHSLQQLYFTLHYEHQLLQEAVRQKQNKIIKQQDHIKIQQNKIKELHLEIARILKTNQILKEGLSNNKIKNMSLEQENQYLMKKSLRILKKDENRLNPLSSKKDLSCQEKQKEQTESTQLAYLKTYQHQQINIPLMNIGQRLANTETKPNRRKHQSEILQYNQRRENKQPLHF